MHKTVTFCGRNSPFSPPKALLLSPGFSRGFPGATSFSSRWNVWGGKASVWGLLGWGTSWGPSQVSPLELNLALSRRSAHGDRARVLEQSGGRGPQVYLTGVQGRTKSQLL